MVILLDIDGVLVTTPSWKPVEQLVDGFMKFNESCVKNLDCLFRATNASIVLTSTHRVNYSVDEWYTIFRNRGLNFHKIVKINDKQIRSREIEIKEWVDVFGEDDYLIIDDDSSINSLSDEIKNRFIFTKTLIGFDRDCMLKAFNIINLNKSDENKLVL